MQAVRAIEKRLKFAPKGWVGGQGGDITLLPALTLNGVHKITTQQHSRLGEKACMGRAQLIWESATTSPPDETRYKA